VLWIYFDQTMDPDRSWSCESRKHESCGQQRSRSVLGTCKFLSTIATEF